MNKHEFLSKVKSVDEQAYIKIKRISHIANLDSTYAEEVSYMESYLKTDIPSQALEGLFYWGAVYEGTDYWSDVCDRLVLAYE